MIIDAPEMLTEQVAEAISWKLSENEQLDALGWILLVRLGEDPEQVLQHAILDVVVMHCGEIPVVLSTHPLGVQRFTVWLMEKANSELMRWIDHRYDMAQWLDQLQARYRQEQNAASFALSSEDLPSSDNGSSSNDGPSTDDLPSSCGSPSSSTSPSSMDSRPSKNAASNEVLPSSEELRSSKAAPCIRDKLSNENLRSNRNLLSKETSLSSEHAPSNEDLPVTDDALMSKALPFPTHSLAEASEHFSPQFIAGLIGNLQRRHVHVREDLIRRYVPAAETMPAEPVKVAAQEPSCVCENPFCCFSGKPHAKTWRCADVNLARTMRHRPAPTSAQELLAPNVSRRDETQSSPIRKHMDAQAKRFLRVTKLMSRFGS
nr:hypothetical protein B0A51_01220 [Rachicladosporium sp. CCFEE 5018]